MTYYVNMHDTRLSGWGEAVNKLALFCVRCETYDQAVAIEKAAHRRSEMKRIAISDHPLSTCGVNQRTICDFADMGGSWLEFYYSGGPDARRQVERAGR